MSNCDCDNYIDCGSPRKTVPTISADVGSFGHSYKNEMLLDNIMEFHRKTTRDFSATYSSLAGQTPTYFIACTDDAYPCHPTGSGSYSSSCSENCTVEINVPYYWDQQRDIYLWKHTKEILQFSVSSNKTAQFKTKWGVVKLHKIIIPTSVRTTGLEEFVFVKDGIKKILAAVTYDYNPFPVTDMQGGNWGLYGNVVNNVTAPDTSGVACILVLPIPGKGAMCQDNDCLYWGFYDYNAVEGGFVENSLARDDGGKDFFYPYWCRSMPIDTIWRSTADTRYGVIYSMFTQNLAGTTAWTPPDPTVFQFPFGSFALDSKENFIASCILQFGEHASNKGIVYNYASMGDLFAAITKTGPSMSGKFSSVYPVAPI